MVIARPLTAQYRIFLNMDIPDQQIHYRVQIPSPLSTFAALYQEEVMMNFRIFYDGLSPKQPDPLV